MRGKLVEIASEDFDPFGSFRYDAILMSTAPEKMMGNILGEAIITNKEKFKLRRIARTQIILPTLKNYESSNLWEHMGKFLNIPKEIALSLFGFSELNWQALMESRPDYNECKAGAVTTKVMACKGVWVSYGFLPVGPCSVQASREVQLFNVKQYLNLTPRGKKDLLYLTNKFLTDPKI